MANKRRDAGKERFWRDTLARQAASGLSVRGFCGRERVTESAFHAWRRTIAERDAAGKRSAKRPPWKAPAFVPAVVTSESRRQDSIEIELAGGRVLRLPEAIPAHRLAELVRALEAPAREGLSVMPGAKR